MTAPQDDLRSPTPADDDIKLLVLGWITTVLGLPENADPTKYNELTDRLCEVFDGTVAERVLAIIGPDDIVEDEDEIAEYHPKARAYMRSESERNEARNQLRAELRSAVQTQGEKP